MITTEHSSPHRRPSSVRLEILLGEIGVAAWLENAAGRLRVKTKEHRRAVADIAATIHDKLGFRRQAAADTFTTDDILHHDISIGYRKPIGKGVQNPAESMGPFALTPEHRFSRRRRIQRREAYRISHGQPPEQGERQDCFEESGHSTRLIAENSWL